MFRTTIAPYCLAFFAAFSLMSTSACKSRKETTSATQASAGDSARLEDLIFRVSFVGLNAALSAYDTGRLDFLAKAYNVIANLPHDPRFTQLITDEADLWSPLACVKIVQLQRLLNIPFKKGSGVSRCLANVESFEGKVGTLVAQGEAAYDKATGYIPGATLPEKLANLRTFYENFGGLDADIDAKVATGLALLNLYRDFSQDSSQNAGINTLSRALQPRIKTILRYVTQLADQNGYINGDAYDIFFREIDRGDLRKVLSLILRQSDLNLSLQDRVIDFYDNNNGSINSQLFTAAYGLGNQPFVEILTFLGVRAPAAQTQGSYVPNTGGNRVKISELIDLWNAAYNGGSANPYRDIYNLLPRGPLPSGKSLDIRRRIPAVLNRLSFPRGLPARKLATAINGQLLPLDLIIGSAEDGHVVTIE